MTTELEYDLTIKSIRERGMGCAGRWVTGTIDGHYFEALAFDGHAEIAEYELGTSRVSKMYLKCLTTGREVFNFDRGLDIKPRNRKVAAIVDFLCDGVADLAFA